MLLLDNDVIVRSPLDPVFDTLGQFQIGMVLEQATHLRMASKNHTYFNGGLQLLNFPEIRRSTCHARELTSIAKGRHGQIGWNSDQHVYTMLHGLCGHIRTLGCEWNRQFGSYLMDVHTRRLTLTHHIACSHCYILHFNDQMLKKQVASLQDNVSTKLALRPRQQEMIRECLQGVNGGIVE
jgi:lipopolysaccharide biosynthesis glycosyltransferase